MLNKFFSRKSRGFTLVELLIVVAIIGVLATVGVPTFRRMIQKSKKSEAKVNLGALYTAEAAFYAEYNAYGNNLPKLGFQIEGTNSTTGQSATLIYNVGFPTAACAAMTVAPATGNTAGDALNAAFPGYYGGTAYTVVGSTVPTACLTNAQGTTLQVASDGSSFLAAAQGVIAPGATGANSAQFDAWSMNDQRVLANFQDGVN